MEMRPDELAEKAVGNCSTLMMNDPVPSLSQALVNGFTWDKTREGHQYWADIHAEVYEAERSC